MTLFSKKYLLVASVFYFSASSLSFAMDQGEVDGNQVHVARVHDVALDFSDERTNWYSNYADYSIGQEDMINFNSQINHIPNLQNTTGYLLGGTNVSDDLFMYVATKHSGFKPDTNYEIKFKDLVFATNEPPGRIGVGGAPGESVYVKAGAAALKPSPQEEEGFVKMNIDKGIQSNNGKNAIVMGNFAKTNNSSPGEYELKHITLNKSILVKTNPKGNLWFFVGTDSGFESRTEIYFKSANFEVSEH